MNTPWIGTPIDGGWRIKLNDAGTHWIDVLWMIYNYRIALTPVTRPMLIDRHWCYAGRDEQTLLRTVAAAYAWDGGLDTEPVGWNKNGQTQEWRLPEQERDEPVALFFGDRWDAPQVDDATQVDTPVGHRCLFCAERIEPGDRGLLRPHAHAVNAVGMVPVHMECDLRMGLGSVAHLEGRCDCGDGSAVEPPGRSFRTEAWETLTWLNAQRATQGRAPL